MVVRVCLIVSPHTTEHTPRMVPYVGVNGRRTDGRAKKEGERLQKPLIEPAFAVCLRFSCVPFFCLQISSSFAQKFDRLRRSAHAQNFFISYEKDELKRRRWIGRAGGAPNPSIDGFCRLWWPPEMVSNQFGGQKTSHLAKLTRIPVPFVCLAAWDGDGKKSTWVQNHRPRQINQIESFHFCLVLFSSHRQQILGGLQWFSWWWNSFKPFLIEGNDFMWLKKSKPSTFPLMKLSSSLQKRRL